VSREKGREKGEGRREKGEGRREKGEGTSGDQDRCESTTIREARRAS